jgi:hypothetical protein
METSMDAVTDNKSGSLNAGPGMHVVVAFILEEGEERLEFDVVSDDQADFAKGFLGAGTPLAKAIFGQAAGAQIPYDGGDVHAVRIIQVRPSQVAPSEDVKARREETLRKAVEASDRTNAVIFASSFSGKWGDYDPTGFLEDDDRDGPHPPAHSPKAPKDESKG